MGLDQSKTSRQAKTNIIDFPQRNLNGNRNDLDCSPQCGARLPPNVPPRSSSFAKSARPTVGELESSASSRSAAAYEPRDKLYREKYIRSCLSWEKETSSTKSNISQKTENHSAGKYPKGTCDKCDGPHLTDDCPIYKKKRDDHPDAWRNSGKKSPLEMGKGGGNFRLRSARVVRQPGDGSCLFHSLAHGLGGTSASVLRRDIAGFIQRHPDLEIAETPMRDWVKWDSGSSVAAYAARMAVSGWGGGIEMAACSHLKKVNVHVYEKERFGYKRISCFDVDSARATVHVLYCGGVHFDALEP
uniref:Ubiquitin thioesterase OTU n=1 Tax=Cryptomonas curvata TaxID=233186 RepID=A0A7S0QWX0_9CRYP|mmetsp:Transcript_9864/g.21072  ORF Transcript_9864/g.21072 Transcript_9864/m.21072 type:complete len:301 (+) Transcript_9864:182-1084(+)